MSREAMREALTFASEFFRARALMASPGAAKLRLNSCEVACLQAIELLDAQTPRVVKISELTSGEPMLVWLEDIDKEETVAGMVFDYVPGRLGFKLTDLASRDRIYPRIEEYLTRWRCWTSRPTEEQREATPWPT